MTRDDIRKLIGGYATGSLTEAERKILFEAALDDQELFDELAREQALKELLDGPGVKQRLITGLKPQPALIWKRPLMWVGATAAVAVLLTVSWVATRPTAPQQLAEVRQPAPPVASTPPSPAVDAIDQPSAAKAVLRASSITPKKPAKIPQPAPAVAAAPSEAVTAVGSVGAASGALSDSSTRVSAETNKSAGRGGGGGGGLVAPRAAPTAASPEPMQAAASSSTQSVVVSGQDVATVASPRNRAELAAPAPLAKMAPRFGFSYSVQADGSLVVSAVSDGYLNISSVFPETFVVAGSTTRIDMSRSRLSSGAIGGFLDPGVIVIRFSARKDVAGTPTQIERNGPSGMVEDPKPSPNSALILRLIVK